MEISTCSRPLSIKMDFREQDSGIGEILAKNYGMTVTSGMLAAGDFVLEDEIAVERKTAPDLACSIVDGRLFRQAAQLRRCFDHAIVLVEGGGLDHAGTEIHPHAVKGALVSMALQWRIPVLFSRDPEDTALFLWLMASQTAKASGELSYRAGRRPKRIFRRQLYLLQGLPSVGPALARRLLDHFGSVEKVITAPADELKRIPGLGPGKAGKIRDLVSAPVTVQPPRHCEPLSPAVGGARAGVKQSPRLRRSLRSLAMTQRKSEHLPTPRTGNS